MTFKLVNVFKKHLHDAKLSAGNKPPRNVTQYLRQKGHDFVEYLLTTPPGCISKSKGKYLRNRSRSKKRCGIRDHLSEQISPIPSNHQSNEFGTSADEGPLFASSSNSNMPLGPAPSPDQQSVYERFHVISHSIRNDTSRSVSLVSNDMDLRPSSSHERLAFNYSMYQRHVQRQIVAGQFMEVIESVLRSTVDVRSGSELRNWTGDYYMLSEANLFARRE